MTELALGHFVRFYNNSDAMLWAFQNFYINEDVNVDGIQYLFVPFGFSGLSASKEADLAPATLLFPSNNIARAYLGEALRGYALDSPVEGVIRPYVAEVDVNVLDIDSPSVQTKLLTYTGQCTGGGWDDTTLKIELSSVLDAASADIPTRTLNQKLVGALPLTSAVNLR